MPELFISYKFNIKKKVIKHIYEITFYVIRNDKKIYTWSEKLNRVLHYFNIYKTLTL